MSNPEPVKWCRAGDLFDSDHVVAKAIYDRDITVLEDELRLSVFPDEDVMEVRGLRLKVAEQAKTIERLEHERWMLAANIHARRNGMWANLDTWDEMEQAEKIADAALELKEARDQ